MRSWPSRQVVALPVVLLAFGCATDPDPLLVGEGGLGERWELVYWEGPVTIAVSSVVGESLRTDRYTVEGYGMTRRGWGALLPWTWFRESTQYAYVVEKYGPDGSLMGAAAYNSFRPISGFFSRPDVAVGFGDEDPTPPDGFSWERCRAARDEMLAQRAEDG